MIHHDVCPVCKNANIAKVLSAKDYTVSNETFDIWECENCRLRFTQNIPSLEESSQYYQSENYISHSDTSQGLINNLYHKVRKRTLVQKRKLVIKETRKKAGNILDIGCGTGAFLNTMKKANWQITGLEPDGNARQKANELYGIQPRSAEDIYDLEGHTFDAITLWHVLEHVHDVHGYMKKIKHLLNAEGRLFIAVPNYTSYDAKHYKEYWAAYDVPRHLYHFSPKSMVKLWNIHGIKVNSIEPMWYDSVYVSMLSEQYKNGKPGAISGAITGALSNMNTLLHTKKCSSIIYTGEAI